MTPNPHSPPRSPFAASLSGSAKETELRLRSIFQWKKRRPPALFLLLAALCVLLCSSLVSCQQAPAPVQGDDPSSSDQSPVSQPIPARELTCDLNHNGIPEEIRLAEAYGEQEVQIWEGETLITREAPGICLCTLEGKDYILRPYADLSWGSCSYHYTLADFSGEFEETLQWNEISFDLAFGAPYHQGFDPQAIASYVERLNDLLSHSVLLFQEEGELLARQAPAEELDWLDDFPDVFLRDQEKSLAENLRAYQAAMSQAFPPPVPLGQRDSLPLEEPLELIYASGAGAWGTVLELRADGSFTGDYHDSDGNIQYVCQFHGTFRDFVQLTDSSWLLTLEELVLDTGRPVGAEWDAGGFHRISSQPVGFCDGEGEALLPGAQFILYSPQATGHAPGTELYGAYEFWSWWPNRHALVSAWDTLGCYGLHNLETGNGFFS